MREYTAKKMKLLKANLYTFKVIKNKLYFTVEFKEAFWTPYQAGMAPRKIGSKKMDYYNNERYQWQLAKLSPNEYYEYITTGVYPLKGIVNEDKEEHEFSKTN